MIFLSYEGWSRFASCNLCSYPTSASGTLTAGEHQLSVSKDAPYADKGCTRWEKHIVYNSAKVGFTRSEKKIIPGTKGGVGYNRGRKESDNLRHRQVVRGAQS